FPTSPFPAFTGDGMIDQNLPHQVCRDTNKMRPILTLNAFLIDQPQKCLMHERSGLQRMVRTFTAKIVPGEPAKLFVDNGHQLTERVLISCGQFTENPSRLRLPQRFFRPAAHIHHPPVKEERVAKTWDRLQARSMTARILVIPEKTRG